MNQTPIFFSFYFFFIKKKKDSTYIEMYHSQTFNSFNISHRGKIFFFFNFMTN